MKPLFLSDLGIVQRDSSSFFSHGGNQTTKNSVRWPSDALVCRSKENIKKLEVDSY